MNPRLPRHDTLNSATHKWHICPFSRGLFTREKTNPTHHW